jgi:O-antigen ligase
VLAVLAILFGNMEQDRLVLDRGRFTNPNDLAQILLMGFPFWWYVALNPNLKRSRRVGSWLAMIPIFMAMSKTGSRGALVASMIVALVLFWRSSVSHKVLLAAGVLVLVLLGAVFLPATTKERYFTFFKGDEDSTGSELTMEGKAVSSTYGRWHLLKDSVTLTLLHPVFGVGPGEFDVAQDLYSRAVRYHKGDWQVTHNTYTEFSSECGLPALILYCLAFFSAFRLARVPKSGLAQPSPGNGEVASASFCLRLSLLSYLVSSLFGSFAYQTQFPVLAGLAVAFSRTAAQELRAAAQRAPAPEGRKIWVFGRLGPAASIRA